MNVDHDAVERAVKMLLAREPDQVTGELVSAGVYVAQAYLKLKQFKDYVHGRLDAAGVPTDPESPHRAEGCRIGGRLDLVLADRQLLHAIATPGSPAPAEVKAKLYKQLLARSEDGKPEGTRESLERSVRMIDTYAADALPADPDGRIHFARAMLESVADEIRAYLDRLHTEQPREGNSDG